MAADTDVDEVTAPGSERRVAAADLDALAESVYVKSYLGVGAARAETGRARWR